MGHSLNFEVDLANGSFGSGLGPLISGVEFGSGVSYFNLLVQIVMAMSVRFG